MPLSLHLKYFKFAIKFTPNMSQNIKFTPNAWIY